MIIKVCGLRDAENIRAISQLDIDMMGFIFWPQSPRYVQMISSRAGIIPDYSEERLKSCKKISPESPAEIKKIKRVGVFVDDMPQNIITRVFNYNLDVVQLHGQESRIMIENLRRTIDPDIRPGIQVIKAISIEKEADFAACQDYEGVVDGFLFDTKCPSVGGSGTQFNWSMLKAYQGQTPFLLSGGIGPDDADAIKAIQHPQFAGIDLNSRFETSPGVKDVEMIQKFISKLR